LKKEIVVAHSPDADDIFMYFAIKFGWVSTRDMLFSNIALDIETLNQEAIKGTYDISAISFALYPYIKDDYALLKSAISFGEGYGPKLIKQKKKN
jgi:1,4-dihydroxy-6-naphthoate synthase